MTLKIDGTMRRLGLVAALALMTTPALAQAQRASECAVPETMNDGWATAAPESIGLDCAPLREMGARLRFDQADVHAVVVGALDVLNNFVIASVLDKNQSNTSRKASP